MKVDWQPIATVPRDRYVLLFSPETPRWDGNMDVGKWWGDSDETGCFWSCGGPNGGLELNHEGLTPYTHWAELPDDPK